MRARRMKPMRIAIFHETVYRYETPAYGVIQSLHLTPRNHDGQSVLDWRIDASENCQLQQQVDAFGNIAHVLTAEEALSELRVLVEGEVETQDTGGVVSGALERFPHSFYLRDTPLTEADAAITSFARAAVARAGDDQLKALHLLLEQAHDELAYEAGTTQATTSAAEAFAIKRGVCQDLTHIFIAAARSLGIPARYVGGHLRHADDSDDQEAGHAWAEAYVPALGWVAFDVANGVCATEAHVRVAVGLDYLGAAPVRGSRYGGGDESMEVIVRVQNVLKGASAR